MAIPRSAATVANAPSASVRTSANLTVSAIAAGATTVFTLPLPRSFKPNKPVDVVFPSGLQSGLVVGNCTITGNSPSTGATTKGYTLNIPITNTTASSATPTAGLVYCTQQ